MSPHGEGGGILNEITLLTIVVKQFSGLKMMAPLQAPFYFITLCSFSPYLVYIFTELL
jgi:hypothetical protein